MRILHALRVWNILRITKVDKRVDDLENQVKELIDGKQNLREKLDNITKIMTNKVFIGALEGHAISILENVDIYPNENEKPSLEIEDKVYSAEDASEFIDLMRKFKKLNE